VKPDLYLMTILSMVVLASLLPVRGEFAHALGLLTKVLVGGTFFLHGARLPREAVIAGFQHWRLHLVVLGSTYLLFPIVALVLTKLPPWIAPTALAPGMIFLACLPSTVQSSITFTIIARGNVAAAVAAASASNIIGVFLTPALIGLLMHAQGAVSPQAIQSIFLQLLAPFIAGQALRPLIGGWVSRHKRITTIFDRSGILLIVYVAFSSAVVGGVWSQLGVAELVRLLVLCSVLLAAILLISRYAAKRLGFDLADQITIMFCGSKKSLAAGVPMAAILFPAATAGLIVLPVMVFHQIQLMVCAVIASAYARKPHGAEVTAPQRAPS
jgi:sodium/bile acid cotransporter 7